jgi:hypothetical protein
LTFFNIQTQNNNQQQIINSKGLKTCVFYSYMNENIASCGTKCFFNNFQSGKIKIRNYNFSTIGTNDVSFNTRKSANNSETIFLNSYSYLRGIEDSLTYNIFYKVSVAAGGAKSYTYLSQASPFHDQEPLSSVYPHPTPVAGTPTTDNLGGSGKVNMQHITGPFDNPCVTVEAKYYVPNILLPPDFEYYVELKTVSKFVKISDDTTILNTNSQSSDFKKYTNNDHYSPHCHMSFVTRGNNSENLKIVLQLDGDIRQDCARPPAGTNNWSAYDYASRRIPGGNICCITIHGVPLV